MEGSDLVKIYKMSPIIKYNNSKNTIKNAKKYRNSLNFSPIEHWHEKTLLLGLTVTRDSEDCVSSSDCKLERQLYLASMQYDGKVSWGGENWGGGPS